MKKVLTPIIVSTLMVILITGCGKTDSLTSTNLVHNGDFEQGTSAPVGWHTENQFLNDITGWTPDESHSGKHSLKIENIGRSDAHWVGEPIVFDKSIQGFNASVWTKAKDINSGGKYQIAFDVFLKDDGDGVKPPNQLSNGDFERWSAGTSSSPDEWGLDDGGAVKRSTEQVKIGTYSAKLTVLTDCCRLQYRIDNTVKKIDYWKGKTLTFGCWVYATKAGTTRLQIYDGSRSSSSYHTGDSTWQWLTVTRTVDPAATRLYVFLNVEGKTSSYFDGAMCVEGAKSFAFRYKPLESVFTNIPTNKTGWQQVSLSFIIPNKTKQHITKIIPYLILSGTTGTVWFDDLSVNSIKID